VPTHDIIIRIKENSGIERAVLTEAFSSGNFFEESFGLFAQSALGIDLRMKRFFELANPDQKAYFKAKMKNEAIDKVLEMRKIAFNTKQKKQIIAELVHTIGYGGAIHNIKNYLIRADTDYAFKFDSKIKQIPVRNLQAMLQDRQPVWRR